ncbi:hypothetical protein SAMN06297387_102432 [Streptomyces zhaozhouensis]|uniref:Pyridoxamine 5'-phosphate oxidase n=1 Tax=Streptomyces zhaozhouensis TaxID=1300267 RepID=A0A286DQT9_9ACTN|nr:hypothetical protein [Streptomyces zhaozhouensis]SOD61016.1 hypothetical protein SAMN06297387_102432 [Streptomyces zhaozhouensis]
MATTAVEHGFDRALIEEAARKSALVWVRGPQGPARPLWHVWHDGALWLVGGPGEQPLDGLGLVPGGRATVSCRSKDKGGRLVVWAAEVAEPGREDPSWATAVAELAGKRLNAPDTASLADRWAAECTVLRLAPVGEPLQRPGAMPDDGGAAAPLPTPASTRVATPSGLPTRRRARRGGRQSSSGSTSSP